MHSEILKYSSDYFDHNVFDDDEISYEAEIERLMDMLNDHGTVNQIDAIEICKQRDWSIHKEFDPCHYYANEHGYFYWFEEH